MQTITQELKQGIVQLEKCGSWIEKLGGSEKLLESLEAEIRSFQKRIEKES